MAKKSDGSAGAADEDFGLERMHQEYHRHGGPQGDAEAKKLEGDIASSDAKHDHELKKARPDGTATRGK
jgi:hypothetical protein